MAIIDRFKCIFAFKGIFSQGDKLILEVSYDINTKQLRKVAKIIELGRGLNKVQVLNFHKV